MGNYICSRAELQEELRKYKEAYTPEETELNKRLYEECSKEPIDFVRVEELLKQGADPLGNTGEFDWSFVDHISFAVGFERTE